MATPRSPSFYTNFFRAVRSCEPTTYQSLRNPPTRCPKARGRTTIQRAQSTYQNRYGPAATDHLPPPPKPTESVEQPKKAEPSQKQPTAAAKSEQKVQQTEPSKSTSQNQEVEEEEEEEEKPTIKQESKKATVQPPLDNAIEKHEAEISPPQQSQQQSQAETSRKVDPETSSPTKELDMVLSVPSPSEVKTTNEANSHRSKHPHLEPSPHEHHFDTYSLVQELAKDTFTEHQSITLMKAIRLMLANNLDVAKEGLVSKSDIENESYLFRAACSELRTTLQTSRFAENQRQRTARASLQHEHDILSQKVTQDVLTMREELKGMFNDRKMRLQEEKRKIDSQISELNYEITVLLNSEAKSEVEGLRWVLTRRAAMAIGTAAFMTLCALQYYSIKSREQAEIEKRRQAAQKVQDDRIAAESARYTTPSRSSGTQTNAREYEEALG